MAIRERTLKNGKVVYSFTRRVRTPEGKIKQYTSEYFKGIREAEEAERVFLVDKKHSVRKNFDIVAKAYFKEMYKKRKESTVYSYENLYENNIKPFFEKYDIGKIEIADVKLWREGMDQKNLSVSYKNKCYTVLSSIMKYAMQNFNLPSNPVAILGPFETTREEIVKPEDKLHYITFEQFQKLINTIEEDGNELWLAFFNTLYWTGARKGEIQGLFWKDINFDDKTISITKTLSTKTKEAYKLTSTKNNLNRKIKMNKSLYDSLIRYKKYVMQYKDFSEDWFVFGNTRFLPHKNIDRYRDKYFDAAEIPRIKIHDFRHSAVSCAINEYIKVSKEKNMKVDMTAFFLKMSVRMGHTVDVMQRTYMHLFPTAQDEIVDLLDNL